MSAIQAAVVVLLACVFVLAMPVTPKPSTYRSSGAALLLLLIVLALILSGKWPA